MADDRQVQIPPEVKEDPAQTVPPTPIIMGQGPIGPDREEKDAK